MNDAEASGKRAERMSMENTSIRILARHLRRKLEGRVPTGILARLTDSELVEKYRQHHETKLAALRDGVKLGGRG